MTKKRKSNQPVTFDLLTEFYADFLKPQFNKLNEKMEKGFGEVYKRLTKVEDKVDELNVKFSHFDDQLDGLKADLSSTVSSKEFNQLKRKVETLQAS